MSAALAAKIYVALSAIVIVFELGLAAGLPWGALTTWGAYPGALPAQMRIAAVGSAVMFAAFAAIVAARAGIALPGWRRASRWLIWVVVAFMLFGTVLNVVAPGAGQRAIWLPVTVVGLVCAVRVALSRGAGGGQVRAR